MFNTTITNKNVVSTHINAVTGQISKTYRQSFFKKINLKSQEAETLLSSRPRFNENYNTVEVVIIQMVVVGDMEVIAELMKKSEYNKMLDEQ